MSSENWPIFVITYNLEGRRYSIEIPARDADEARRRLATAAQWGTVDGELIMRIPVPGCTIMHRAYRWLIRATRRV